MRALLLLQLLLAAILVLPAASQNATTVVNPTSAGVEWFTKAAPAGSTVPNAYQAQVTLTFAVPNVTVTSWGTPVREGNNVNLTIAAVQGTTAAGGVVAGTPTIATRLFDLGALPLGAYNLRIFSGSLLVRSIPFTAAQYPPSIPATATVLVNPANSASVSAAVTLQFTQVVGMRPQPAVTVDSAGRYILEAIADRSPGATTLNVLPPAFNLSYLLGSVPAGNKVAVFRLNGVTLAEQPFVVAPTAPEMKVGVTFTKNVTTTGVAIKARVAFTDSYWSLTNQGVATKIDNVFNIAATASAAAVLPTGASRVFEPVYNLGLLPAGSYHLNYSINGTLLGQYDFTVEATPPPPAPIALQAFGVRPEGTTQVADVVLSIGSPATQITGWGTAVKVGAIFTANVATSTSSDPVIQVVRTETHSYALGAPEPGTYTFVQQVDGREIGRRAFTILSPALPRFLYLKPIQTTTGYQMEAALALPPNTVVSDWGSMSRTENKFTATVAFATAITANASATGSTVTHRYELGNLDRGVYEAALLKTDAALLGSIQFAVGGIVPPPPPEDGITLESLTAFTDAGSIHSRLSVNISNPSSIVLDWGSPIVTGNTITFALKIGPRPANVAGAVAAPIVAGPHLEMHTYDLGALTAGTYTGIVSANATEIGRRQLVVGTVTPPPPPPPPVPNIAYVKFGSTSAGRTAEIGILLPSATQEVTDWGTVTTAGNKLRVCVSIGSSAPPAPVDPAELPSSEANAAGAVALADLASASAAGASPVRLATHTYALGALSVGAYTFTVCIGERDVVTQPFVVEGNAAGVYAQLLPSNIEAVKSGANLIHLQFKSSNGMATAAGATITVTGPNGFSAPATFKSEGIISADPLGMILNADFAVATSDGSWDAADSGSYRVSITPASVTDKAGNPLINGQVGAFTVRIWPTVPPTPLPVMVSVNQAEGAWQAKVTLTTSSTQRPWKIKSTKSVVTIGSVLNLAAELEPGVAGTDPAQIILTYDLGTLPAGNYRAVFKSNVGHCGVAAFVVAGVEPPKPIGIWQQLAFANGDWNRPEIIADLADPDGDGTPNITEYCLGTDPIRPDAPQFHPTVERDATGQPHLVILFRRASNTADATVLVEVSKDLKTWQPAGADVEITIRSQDIDGTELVCACQKAILGQPGSWPFMRLQLQQAPVSP